MEKRDRAAVRYCIALLVVSILQVLLIRGLMTSENVLTMQTELTVDGADFSPWLSLAASGIQSAVYAISFAVDLVIGILLSGITMLILRLRSRALYTAQTARITLPFTLCTAVLSCLVCLLFTHFHLIPDVLLLYLPAAVLAWCVFHLGAKPQNLPPAA